MDPHKWLYAPLEAGCTLVRRRDDLHNAFGFKPSYYQFDDNEGQEVKNYHEYGPQNSRGFRALKIWLGFQQSGASGYRRMIADDIELAHRLYDFVGEQELLERGTVSLSIATFRFVPADLRKRAKEAGAVTDYLNELNARIATALSVWRIRRGGATTCLSRCVPWERDRATDTCPRGRPPRARMRSRCGRGRRPRARTRSCQASLVCMWRCRFRS